MSLDRTLADYEFYAGDIDEDISYSNYFKQLLIRLIEEGEDFSGKRPFGNNGWWHCLTLGLEEFGFDFTEDDPDKRLVEIIEGIFEDAAKYRDLSSS